MWIEINYNRKTECVNLDNVTYIEYYDDDCPRIEFHYTNKEYSVFSGSKDEVKDIYEYVMCMFCEETDGRKMFRYPTKYSKNDCGVVISYELPKIAKNMPNLDKCVLINE